MSLIKLPGQSRNILFGFMKSILVFVLMVGGIPAVGDEARAARRARACFYEKPDYRGRRICVRVGRSSRRVKPKGWTAPIASVRLYGRALVVFYYHAKYRGRRMAVTVNEPNLNRYGFLRRDMRSLRVRRGRWTPQVCFYSKAGFRGDYFCKTPFQYVANLELIGWRKRIGSFHVRGRAQIRFYGEIEFKGRKMLLTRTNSDTSRVDLNKWVHSLRVQRRGDKEKVR